MVLSLLRKRRSIRKFKPQPIDQETIAILRETVLRAPSSRGLNPWRFVFVSEPGLLAKLARCKEHGSAFLKGAALAVVVCADPECSDVWIEDCAIAATVLQLVAEEQGLGSCWVQVRCRLKGEGETSEKFVRDLLQIPENMVVDAVVGIGYPAEEKPGHPLDSLEYDKVFKNTFGQN